MKIKPIPDYPASILNDKLIISDLHLGIERSYKKDGIRIPTQTRKYRKKINELIKVNDLNEVIFLGDLKNQIPTLSWQERKEIPAFLKEIKVTKIKIIPGNHDGNIDKLIPDTDKVEIKEVKGIIEDNVYLLHGHTWPKKQAFMKEEILIGHNHPMIVFEDELGRKHNEKTWIKTKLNKKVIEDKYKEKINWEKPELIIQPAFSELVGGIPFNAPKESYLGPLFNSGATQNKKMESTLLDGTYLGEVNNLKEIDYGKE